MRAADEDPLTETRTNWTGVLTGLSFGVYAAYQQFKLPPVLPVLLERYDYDLVLAGGFMSIIAVAGLVLSYPLGEGVQRRGMPRFLAGSFALMAAGNLVMLAAPESGWLVLTARGMEGVAFTTLALSGPALMVRSAERKDVPLVIGLVATWIPAGQLIASFAAAAAGAAAGQAAWRPLWWLALAMTAALAAWLWRSHRRGTVDLAPPQADSAGGRPPSRRERLCVIAGAGIFGLWTSQYFAYMTWMPQYLVAVHGLDPTSAAWGYALPVATLLIFCLITGAVLRAGVPVGVLLIAALASQAAVWLLLPVTAGAVAGLASLLAYGAGAGVSATCLLALPSTILGKERAGPSAFGIVMTGRNLGIMAGPVVLAYAFGLAGDWQVGSPIFGAITAAAMVGAILLNRALGRGAGR